MDQQSREDPQGVGIPVAFAHTQTMYTTKSEPEPLLWTWGLAGGTPRTDRTLRSGLYHCSGQAAPRQHRLGEK